MNVKDASGRLAQWALLLQQYDFEIVYRPGKVHKVKQRYWWRERTKILNTGVNCLLSVR